ncbi:MAG: ABC transporter permease [Pseudomonadales bacterium]|nr:ABC transporter permease [Pseudomonadales bacterium]
MIISKSDLKYTFRKLAQSPGFALLATVVLAGGLGVSLFTFTLFYIMGYKTIDLPNGDRVVQICAEGYASGCIPFKAFEFASFRDDITTLENISVSTEYRVYVQSDEVFHQASVLATESKLFQLTESSALLGRVLQESDLRAGAEPVAVLAHDFWQLAFDASPAVIDEYVDMGGESTRIVGVMPAGYKFPRWTDIWVPATPALIDPAVNTMTQVAGYALRKQGVSGHDASAEIAGLMNRMRRQYPVEDPDQYQGGQRLVNAADSGFVTSLPAEMMSGLGNQLASLLLSVMAVILFLLACINVGTLLLARTNERLKDLSIRVALGAPRVRLLMQTMGESIVIALVGAVLAVLFAGLCLEAMNIFMTTLLSEEGLQFWMDFKVDGFTVVIALVFAILTVLLTSALPAWKLINGNFNSVMQDGTRGALGLRAGRFSKSLVIVAIALITILLYTFTVFISVLWSMGSTYEIIDPEGISSVEIGTNEQFNTRAERLQFFQSLQGALQANPDVSEVLMMGIAGVKTLEVEGTAYLSEQDKPTAPVQIVSGDLNFIGASLLEGRYLSELDNQNNAPSALVSRSLAERLWPGDSPIGRSLRIAGPQQSSPAQSVTIVGMISDSPIDGAQMFKQEFDMVYLPLGQMDSTQITAIIRSGVSPQAAIEILGNTVLGLNSGVNMSIVAWVENRQTVTFVILFGISVFTAIGLFAFLVSVAGVFGLTQNSVILRTQEIGTRRALGATDGLIGRTFTLQGARQVFIGIVIATLVCSPFSLLIYNTAGPQYILPGLAASSLALTLLLICVLLAIYHPIQTVLRKEPSELLRYQ